MKILVDCFGGDNCPQEAVKGAVLALNEKSDLFVGLVGQKDKIEEILNTLTYDKSRLEIIEANDVVTNDDNPIMAIRKKKDSSMVVSLSSIPFKVSVTCTYSLPSLLTATKSTSYSSIFPINTLYPLLNNSK